MLRSVLVAVDLARGSGHVVERAVLLPLAAQASLTLLHVVPRLRPEAMAWRVEGDARKALAGLIRRIPRALRRRIRIRSVVATGSAADEIARHARASKPDLIVLGRAGGRPLRDLFIGSTAERVLRRGQHPILVVRRPARGPYRRPLLALALDAAAEAALAFVVRVVPPPRPPMSVVHVYDAPLEGFAYPSVSGGMTEHRRHFRELARRRIEQLLARPRLRTEGDRVRWAVQLRHGSPRVVLPEVAAKRAADLLVLGTHGRSGLAQAFLGSVAGDVLRQVRCDVLVVPPRRSAGAD
jgi:nucleotide-binding universal stress UspA family protein